jgi:hypothetical protein
MGRKLFAIAFMLIGVTMALAAPEERFAAVQQHIDYFNKADVYGMVPTCAVPMSILDGMAPHVGEARE